MPNERVIATEAKPKPERIHNGEAIEAFRAAGGQVMHFRPVFRDERGVTVAFRMKGRRVEIATAVQHGADAFTKKIGTKLAVERFNTGKTIHLPFSGDSTDFVREFRFSLREFQQ